MEKTQIKMGNSSNRKYYLDYWRAFMVLLVLIHHSYLPYVIGYDWYVSDVVKTLPYTWASITFDVFMMPIMFFIAGYFAFPSIKNGVKRFMLKKAFRIALPFIIGIIFLAPIMTYISIIHYFPLWDISFFDFWLNHYFTDQFMDPSHYWFLSLLLLFFIVFAAVYAVMKRKFENIYKKSELKRDSKLSSIIFVILFLATSIVLFYLTGLTYPDGSWTYFIGIKFLKLQITRSIIYVLYFIMGIIVFIKRIEFSKKFLKAIPLLIVVTIISTVAFRFFKFEIFIQSFFDLGFFPADLQFYNAIVHVLYCFLIFITLMAIFKKFLTRHSKVLSRIATNSYKIYILHLVYAVFIQYSIVDIQIDIFNKFLITAIGAFTLSLGTSELLRLIKHAFTGNLKMKRQRILALVKIQYKSLIRVPIALFLILLLPVALILIFGLAFGSVYVEDYGWAGQSGSLFGFLVPGFIAISGLFMAIPVALSFSEDREQGLLKRINTTPTTAAEFMGSHLLSNMGMAIIQVAIIFILTFLMGGMRNLTPVGMILAFVFMVVFSLSTIGFGLITATIAKSAKAAGGFVWIFLLPQQMLAANLYPLPPETRVISMFMPLHYASDALTLLFNGVTLSDLRIWSDLGILILFSLALVSAGILLFKKYSKA